MESRWTNRRWSAGRLAGWLLVLFGLTGVLPTPAQQTELRFQRQWPALQQPWYYETNHGLATDESGNLYFVDARCRVHKLSPDGRVVSSFVGCQGVAPPIAPRDIAVDSQGRIYVAEFHHAVTRYGPDGTPDADFVLQPAPVNPEGLWVTADGSVFVEDADDLQQHDADGALVRSYPVDFVFGVELDADDQFVVGADGAVATYDQTGALLDSFGAGVPSTLRAMGIDGSGRIAVVDNQSRVRFYLPDGTLDSDLTFLVFEFVSRPSWITVEGIRFESNDTMVIGTNASIIRATQSEVLSLWSSDGNRDGTFQANFQLGKPAVAGNGEIYVVDHGNVRIQVFDAQGQYLRGWGTSPHEPIAVDIAANGDVLVAHLSNVLTRYDSTGMQLDQWTDATLGLPFQTGDVAVHPDGRLFVVTGYFDNTQSDIYRFDDEGGFDTVLYSTAFRVISALTLDGDGDLLVAEHNIGFGNNQVLTIDSDTGTVLDTVNVSAASRISDIEADSSGNLFLSDDILSQLFRIEAGTGDIETFGQEGYDAGLFLKPHGLAVDSDDNLYVYDNNDRVQKFTPAQLSDSVKAIVVAGGGPYAGNTLWDATQLNANFAFRTLLAQGFSKDTVTYLSADTDLDLDQNGLADEVDGEASNANLVDAILGAFAADAEELVIYLIDHGGFDTFRMAADQILDATTLAGWVDTWQAGVTASRVTVVYDACQSGSFLDELQSSVHDRLVITSSEAQENAYFVSSGTLSFSNLFWTNVFNGQSIGNAFTGAGGAITTAFPVQVPLLDADGDDVPNTAADQSVAETRFIGVGTLVGGSAPVIGSVSTGMPAGNSATISAFGVTDDDEITRVWAVIRPPDFNPGSPDDPVRELPSIDLLPTTGDDYAATYGGFDTPGVYRLTVHAQDAFGNTAVPLTTTYGGADPLKRRAIVVVGGEPGDPGLAGYQTAGQLATEALTQQGYGPDGSDCMSTACDDILFLSNVGLPGSDGTADRVNLEQAITDWGLYADEDPDVDVQDLALYLVGDLASGDLRLSAADTLTAGQLADWLKQDPMDMADPPGTRDLLPGTLTVIVEGQQAAAFAGQLDLSAPDKRSIAVASTSAGGESVFLADGEISFAKFFWSQVYNGASVRQALRSAGGALTFTGNQVPQIDDNGNAVFNELLDGLYASRYFLGDGVILAGDDPFIGTIAPESLIDENGFELFVENVTTTGMIARVVAVYGTSPRVTVELPEITPGRFQVQLPLDPEGETVDIAAFATDTEGNTSLPAVTRAIADGLFGDGFEDG